MARIVVCGYMIRHPVAGNLFAYFQHILGFHRLGHKVVYLEESGWEDSCYNPATYQSNDDPAAGIKIVRALAAEHGVDLPVFFVNRGSGRVTGGTKQDVNDLLRSADLLLNIGGVCWLPEFELSKRRALIDMDPLFSQVGLFGKGVFENHHTHFSYGANIGKPGCTIPLANVDWLPTVPPVVMDLWQNADSPNGAPFTTIANWNAYGAITYQGERYGQKGEEFLRLLDLPSRTTQPLELALAGEGDAKQQLKSAGWLIRNAGEVSTQISTYRNYILHSRGEFSAAKNAYVKSRSGWFSDRSVCYLAAGLPTVLQDTGFTDWLPAGRGVLAFSTLNEAAERLAEVNRDYAAHRRAASEVASQYFDHKVVLPALLKSALEGTQ